MRGPKYKSNIWPRNARPELGKIVTDGVTGMKAYEGNCVMQRGQYRDIKRNRRALDIDWKTGNVEP